MRNEKQDDKKLAQEKAEQEKAAPRETEELKKLQAAQKADGGSMSAPKPEKPKDTGKKDAVGNPIYVNKQGQQTDSEGVTLAGAVNPGASSHERAAASFVTGALPGGVAPSDPRTGRQGPMLPPGAQPMLAIPANPAQMTAAGVGTSQPATRQPMPGSQGTSPDQIGGNEGQGNPARVPDVNPGGAVQDQDRQAPGGTHPAGHGA